MSGYSATTPENSGLNRTGGTYNWNLKEGNLFLYYFDDLDGWPSSLTPEQIDEVLLKSMEAAKNNVNGTTISEEFVRLGTVRGRKIKIKTSGNNILTGVSYIVGDRVYFIAAEANGTVKDSTSLMEKALNSFKILDQAQINVEVDKTIEASIPEELPQTPVAPKQKSDAQDENLMGRVESVVEEEQDVSTTSRDKERHLSMQWKFNKAGNFLRRISYDSHGYPFQFTVFGYIDNARVTKSKVISSGASSGTGGGGSSQKKGNSRYGYKYHYKYAEGKLSEKKLVYSNGNVWMTYAYQYSDNKLTELVYSEDGKLNQKYVYENDEKGNPISYYIFDALRIRKK